MRRTFFGFLYQVLKPETSCREIVRQVQALFALHDQGRVDENSSAYCQARKRLPLNTLCRARVALAAAGQKAAQAWHGLQPKVIDGTTLGAPDTPYLSAIRVGVVSQPDRLAPQHHHRPPLRVLVAICLVRRPQARRGPALKRSHHRQKCVG